MRQPYRYSGQSRYLASQPLATSYALAASVSAADAWLCQRRGAAVWAATLRAEARHYWLEAARASAAVCLVALAVWLPLASRASAAETAPYGAAECSQLAGQTSHNAGFEYWMHSVGCDYQTEASGWQTGSSLCQRRAFVLWQSGYSVEAAETVLERRGCLHFEDGSYGQPRQPRRATDWL